MRPSSNRNPARTWILLTVLLVWSQLVAASTEHVKVGLSRSSLLLGAEYVRSSRPVTEPLFQSSLGGFLRLSGYPDNALVGSDLVFGRITYLQRPDQPGLLPDDLPVYLALGVDSPLEPLYLGYGRTEAGDSSFYLRLGRIF